VSGVADEAVRADGEAAVTAPETAQRHAQDVADGNFGRLMRDFAGNALNEVMELGGPPQSTTKWEISEEPDGSGVQFRVRYANDSTALELKTRWDELHGVRKVAKVSKVAA
jgi:hypothetical protein